MTMGRERDPKGYLHSFDDYAYDQMVRNAAGEMDASYYYTFPVRKLIGYMRQTGSNELLDTLERYLRCSGNVV